MDPIPFKSLPLVARIAAMLTYFLAWLLFAELVIDRHGLDDSLPLYRSGELCLWDVAVLAVLAFSWWRLHR